MMAIATRQRLLALAVLAASIGMADAARADGLSAALQGRIERFVAERAGGSVDSIFVPPLDDFEIDGMAPDSVDVELSTRARPPFRGAVAISVTISDEGDVLKHGVVTADVRTSRQVWVAGRKLTRGAPLTEHDLRVERVSGRTVPRGAVSDPSEIDGQQLNRSLREGEVIRKRYLEPITLVKRGQTVRMVLRGGGLEIVSKGRAVTDGAIGQEIRVINTDSRREVRGRVAEDGAVHVDL